MPAIFLYRWMDRQRYEPFLRFVRDALLLCLPGLIALDGVALLSLSVNDSLGGTASAKYRFFQEYNDPFDAKLNTALTHIGYFLALVIVLAGFGLAAPRKRETAIFAMFWLPVLLLFTLLMPGGLEHYFYRYQHPILPFIAVLAGAGAASLLGNAWRGGIVPMILVAGAITLAVVPMWQQFHDWRDLYNGRDRDQSRPRSDGL